MLKALAYLLTVWAVQLRKTLVELVMSDFHNSIKAFFSLLTTFFNFTTFLW